MAERFRSQKPTAVRKRLREKQKQADKQPFNDEILQSMEKELEILYQKPVSEWDWEELQRGYPRGADGKFHTRQKMQLSPIVLREAQARLRVQAAVELGGHTQSAIDTIAELMAYSRVDMVRFKAAELLLNHVIGMPTARVEVETGENMQSFLADVLVNPDGKEHRVIEGSVVEDEDEDDDD